MARRGSVWVGKSAVHPPTSSQEPHQHIADLKFIQSGNASVCCVEDLELNLGRDDAEA